MESLNRTTQKQTTIVEKLAVLIGGVLFLLALLAGIVALVFYVTGTVDTNSLRWWATILTVIYPPSVVVIWRIAKREAKEHLKGFARGLDGAQLTLASIGRGLSATASMARANRTSMPPIRTDDLLPQVGGMRLIEARRNTDDVIDL